MRYYFDVDGEMDESGTIFPEKSEVPAAAMTFLLELARDRQAKGDVQELHLRVRSEIGAPVCEAILSLRYMPVVTH
jgi:hypothetical protein